MIKPAVLLRDDDALLFWSGWHVYVRAYSALYYWLLDRKLCKGAQWRYDTPPRWVLTHLPYQCVATIIMGTNSQAS